MLDYTKDMNIKNLVMNLCLIGMNKKKFKNISDDKIKLSTKRIKKLNIMKKKKNRIYITYIN